MPLRATDLRFYIRAALRRQVIGTRHDNNARTCQMAFRLSQQATGQRIAVTEGAAGVQQNDIQVSRKLPVLKTVVQNEGIERESAKRLTPRPAAIFARQQWDTGEGLGQQDRLVTRLSSGQGNLSISC
jgi:hypothetical protein